MPDCQRTWYEAIYMAKAADMLLYGRALGLSHSEAEDTLHETFVALAGKPMPDEPVHYCLRAFRNRALNYRRSLWRRVAREFEARRWFEKSPDQTALETRAMRCLAELPRDQREVIVLKLWHKCTYEEIGTLLSVPANTAAGRYRYGIQKLKYCLEGVNYEQDEREERTGNLGDGVALMETARTLPQGR